MIDMQEMARLLRFPEGENSSVVTDYMSKSNKQQYSFTFDLLEINQMKNGNILEIGPANGFFVKNLFELNSGVHFSGMDLSHEMILEAKKINSEIVDSGKVNFVIGDVHSIPFPDNSFDVVFTINTLYFWSDPIKALKEIERVLKSKGKIAITIRSKESMLNMPFTQYGFELYTKENLIDLFSDFNFKCMVHSTLKEEMELPSGKIVQLESHCLVAESE